MSQEWDFITQWMGTGSIQYWWYRDARLAVWGFTPLTVTQQPTVRRLQAVAATAEFCNEDVCTDYKSWIGFVVNGRPVLPNFPFPSPPSNNLISLLAIALCKPSSAVPRYSLPSLSVNLTVIELFSPPRQQNYAVCHSELRVQRTLFLFLRRCHFVSA
jgi:hypothetical protein